MTDRRRRFLALVMAGATAASYACTPYRSKQEKVQAQFAVGTNWPDAIQSLEKTVGPAQMFGGNCKTDLGTIVFTKLQGEEYLLKYPTRGVGAPGNAMPRGPDAFAIALGEAFSHSRCTHAELQYDQYAVVVDVDKGAITSARVSRSQ